MRAETLSVYLCPFYVLTPVKQQPDTGPADAGFFGQFAEMEVLIRHCLEN